MSERPIIFSASMVRALLEGRKTQTRRLAWRDRAHQVGQSPAPSPWHAVERGDLLWVREGVLQARRPTAIPSGDWRHDWTKERVEYLADEPAPVKRHLRPDNILSPFMQGRPSIHMPRWASRITLRVTAAYIERLHDMTNLCAFAEGTRDLRTIDNGWDLRRCFAELWDQLHGRGAWDRNPEVVVMHFDVLHGNIDWVKALPASSLDAIRAVTRPEPEALASAEGGAR